MPRFAANLSFLFAEHDFLARFGAAARAGFRAVEFHSPYEHAGAQIAARLAAEGLECVLFNLPMGERAAGDFGIACLPGREAEFRAGVAKALDYARALACPRLNCIAGRVPAGADRARFQATLAANLGFAARECAREGVDLVVEPINTVDVPGFALASSAEAMALIAEVEGLGLQYDLYHMAMMGEDLAAGLDRLAPAIRHVQFADAPGRHEPGTGRIDFRGLFARLDANGYRGWVSAEYRPSRRTEQTLGWLA